VLNIKNKIKGKINNILELVLKMLINKIGKTKILIIKIISIVGNMLQELFATH
jgi:hypothetical protein